MKNPLNKRIPKELKQDFGKYFVIFAFMVMLIGLVSGFLVSANSIMVSYDEGIEKYKMENGHFTFDKKPDEDLLKKIEDKADINLYDLSYINLSDDNDKKYRVYRMRDQVNLMCVMDGELPAEKDEIAIDRLFAKNNDLKIGDTVHVGKKDLVITGLVALPDYSCLFEKNTDMMFNATNFTIAVMTDDGFDEFGTNHLEYNYAWTYKEDIDRNDDKLNKKMSDDLLDDLKDVIKKYDEDIVDETVDAAKLVMLSDILDEMQQSLKPMGMDLSMFDSEDGRKQLLSQINEELDKEGIDLSEEFGLDKEITLTTDDIKTAMDASSLDVDDAQYEVDHVEDKIITIEDYLPQYQNQAINFTREDVGGDQASFLVFGYLVTLILAFVFGVTISNTIASEAGVIGTLRASGYTKRELIVHYMTLPVLVTFVAAVIGNIIGYTVLKDSMADLYYNSYSLATYKTLWNGNAFVKTTVVPVILMFVVNLAVLWKKLKLSPIRFLRHDLSKRGKKKAFRLNTKIPFMHRFRMRVLFQNISNYITLFFGIFLGAVITIFGFMYTPMLEDYKEMSLDQRICDYQYIMINTDNETDNKQAEKYSMTSLKTSMKGYKEDDVSIYGLVDDSKYIKEKLPEDGAMVSTSFRKKFDLQIGDTIELKDTYTDKVYKFKIKKFYEYDAGFVIFTKQKDYNKTFDKKSGYFTGYFSNEELTDLNNDDIATVIRLADITKTSDQLINSMGSFMDLMMYFGVIMFLLLMYLLSKQIIEKNAQSISMTKILGFYDGEIGSIYIVSTTIVVVLSLIIACPLTDLFLRVIFENYLYKMMSGYIPYVISNSCYIKTVVLGIVCYAAVAILQMRKIHKISKADALKNVE